MFGPACANTFAFFKRIIVWILLICFVADSAAFAGAPAYSQAGFLPGSSAFHPFFFSSEFGRLENERWFSPAPTPEHPFLIHIRSSHGSPEGARQTAGLVRELAHSRKIKTLFVEGAFGELSKDSLQFLPGQTENQKLLENLVTQGELTGAELAWSLPDAGRLQLTGIEDVELYRKNFESFRKVTASRTINEQSLAELRSALDRRATRELKGDELKLFRAYLGLESHSLKDLRQALPIIGKRLGIDFTDARHQRQFPNLTRWAMLNEEEPVNIEKARREIKQSSVVSRVSSECLLTTDYRRLTTTHVEQILFSKPGSNPRFLVEQLSSQMKSAGARFQDMPEFTRLARRRIFEYEIGPELFTEAARAIEKYLSFPRKRESSDFGVSENKAKSLDSRLHGNDKKKLIQSAKTYTLLRKILLLECSRPEYVEFTRRRVNWFSSLLPLAGWSKKQMADFEANVRNAEQFYQEAVRREEMFTKTIREKLRASGQTQAIVVAGGFHTEGLTQFFETNRYSYAVVRPEIKEHADGNYRQIMMQGYEVERTHIEKALIANSDTLERLAIGEAAFGARQTLIELLRGAQRPVLSFPRKRESSDFGVSEDKAKSLDSRFSAPADQPRLARDKNKM
ncbi:MAG: hypothetical protein HY586_07995, partial [Candidatus Omnitrophica bacterium]|nr:hypothetical protein [Candidatus Omnitrophota bacterium]